MKCESLAGYFKREPRTDETVNVPYQLIVDLKKERNEIAKSRQEWIQAAYDLNNGDAILFKKLVADELCDKCKESYNKPKTMKSKIFHTVKKVFFTQGIFVDILPNAVMSKNQNGSYYDITCQDEHLLSFDFISLIDDYRTAVENVPEITRAIIEMINRRINP